MKRELFLRSLPYLQALPPSTTWPPNINEQRDTREQGKSCVSTPPTRPSKKRRTENEVKPKNEIHQGTTNFNSESFLLFPKNEVFVSIEPCIQVDDGSSKNDSDCWLNVGPAFFTTSDDCDRKNTENTTDSHKHIENDPSMCSVEAAIVFNIDEKQKQISILDTSLLKSITTPPSGTMNVTTTKSTTPNTSSTLSFSQSPKTTKLLQSLNSSNPSMSLYFRFEHKHTFLVHHNQIINVFMEPQKQQYQHDSDRNSKDKKIANMSIQFEACIFRIFCLSMESDLSSIEKNEIDRRRKYHETIEAGCNIIRAFLNNDHPQIYKMVRERNKKFEQAQPSTSNEGSSDIEPAQVEQQVLHSSQEESQERQEKKPNGTMDGTIESTHFLNDINGSKEKGDETSNEKGVEISCSDRNQSGKSQTENGRKSDVGSDKSQESTNLQEHMRRRQAKNLQMSSYRKSWKAIETVFQHYCNPDPNSFSIYSKCTEEDDENLSKLIETAASGASNSFCDKCSDNYQSFNILQEHNDIEPLEQKSLDYRYYSHALYASHRNLNDALVKLFPAPTFAKKVRKNQRGINAPSSPYYKDHFSTPKSHSPKKTVSDASTSMNLFLGTDEENTENLESLAREIEKNLFAKHSFMLLPKR